MRVQAICFSNGRLLCARHRKRDQTYWVLPGGHLEAGETLWDALVREIEEETAIAVEEAHLWSLSEFRSPSRHVLDCAFFVTLWSGTLRLGVDPEADKYPASLVDVAWLDRQRFAEAEFLPTLLARRLRAHWDDPFEPAAYLGLETA